MGSLAPEGSVIGQEVFEAVLHACPFDSEREGQTPFLLRPENPSFIPIVDGFGFLLFIREIEDTQKAALQEKTGFRNL